MFQILYYSVKREEMIARDYFFSDAYKHGEAERTKWEREVLEEYYNRENKAPFGLKEVLYNIFDADDFSHHPTLWGLISAIMVQFSGDAKYYCASGEVIQATIQVNQYGNLVSNDTYGKIFSGIINWFITVAKTMQNQRGHLFSDIAGSSTSAGKGNDGAGLPGSFLSTLKELSSLECFKDTEFGENLRKAFQNGIGEGKKQLDLGPFNSLFEGASSKFDMRTEIAIGKELKRQALPVILNEILVRATYFVRRFILQMKAKKTILEIDWKETIPMGNRTIERMMTIASGTFVAVDMAEAAIQSAIKSGGITPAFASNMVLRVNFVGVGRFTVALGTDSVMGISRNVHRNKRLQVVNEIIALNNAKVYYKQAEMWIEAENTEKTIEEMYDTMEASIGYLVESAIDIASDMDEIKARMDYIDKKINNYYSLYSTRILMVLSNNVNMQTYLNDLLMTIKDFESDEKREIIESIAKCFSLRSYKYVGRKSIERRKKRKPNTNTGAIITGSLSHEEKARLTRELLYEYPDRYGVKQATSYFESVLAEQESIVPDKTTIKTRDDAMMIAASIIYSGSLEFPYEVEFLESTIETEVATISNIRIKRKL